MRKRIEDIPIINTGLLKSICRNKGKPILQLTSDTLPSLHQYDWPGNIRKFENILNQALIRVRGGIISGQQLNLQSTLNQTANNDTDIQPQSLMVMEAEHIAKFLPIARDIFATAARF